MGKDSAKVTVLRVMYPLPKKWSEILKVARNVRRLVLKRGSKHSSGRSRGLCHYASHKIHESLKEKKVKSDVVCGKFYGKGHFYVKIGDGILDVTADQFNNNLRDAHERFRMGAVVFGTAKQLQNFYLQQS